MFPKLVLLKRENNKKNVRIKIVPWFILHNSDRSCVSHFTCITLFRPIMVFYKTNNIMQNIPHIQSQVMEYSRKYCQSRGTLVWIWIMLWVDNNTWLIWNNTIFHGIFQNDMGKGARVRRPWREGSQGVRWPCDASFASIYKLRWGGVVVPKVWG